LLLVAAATWLLYPAREPAAPKFVLVRPFVGLGLDSENSWIGDALTQQFIASLSETKTLRVLPWSTSLAIRDQRTSIQELGKRFDVEAILEGSVRRDGSRLQISAQLVDTATERTLWSHRDEREAGELGRIEAGVFQAMASALKLRLSSGSSIAARVPPADFETYRLCLKSLVQADQFAGKSVQAAVEGFEEVVRCAPGYSPALANLANALVLNAFSPKLDREAPLLRAQRVAEQAIALDPTLAEALSALAHAYFHQWQWKQTEHSFGTALSLDPNSSMTLQLFAIYVGTQGRNEEALRHIDRAVQLAPTSAPIQYTRGNVLFHGGQSELAIAAARQALDLDRASAMPYTLVTRACAQQGKIKEAQQVLEDQERMRPSPNTAVWQGNLLALSGQKHQAASILKS